MPQTVKYRVVVGLRRGLTFQTPELSVTVPDIVTEAQVGEQLHQHQMKEWAEATRAGTPMDLERDQPQDELVASWTAVNPDEIAWLQTQILLIGPEHTTPPG